MSRGVVAGLAGVFGAVAVATAVAAQPTPGTWSGTTGTFGQGPSAPSPGPAPAPGAPPGRLQVGILGGDVQYGAQLTSGVMRRLGLVADVWAQPRAGDRWRVQFLFQDPYRTDMRAVMVFLEECGSRSGAYCYKSMSIFTCDPGNMPRCVDTAVQWIEQTAAAKP